MSYNPPTIFTSQDIGRKDLVWIIVPEYDDKAIEWCSTNCKDAWGYLGFRQKWWAFANADEAILFKLAWLK